jgi:signal peptidase I
MEKNILPEQIDESEKDLKIVEDLESKTDLESINNIIKDNTEPVEDSVSANSPVTDESVINESVTDEIKTEESAETEKSEKGKKKDKKKDKKKNGKKEKPQPKKASTARIAVNLFIKVAFIALAVWALLTFVVGIRINYGNHMHPAINDGDLVVSFKLQRPYLNSVVLYKHQGTIRVGRVIGMPGNEIDISDNGALLVNGVTPPEKVFYPTFKEDVSDVKFPLTVEEGKVFILNDFRENTNDSRVFGTIDMNDVQGPLLFILRRRGF